jgi:hypothetical protein
VHPFFLPGGIEITALAAQLLGAKLKFIEFGVEGRIAEVQAAQGGGVFFQEVGRLFKVTLVGQFDRLGLGSGYHQETGLEGDVRVGGDRLEFSRTHRIDCQLQAKLLVTLFPGGLPVGDLQAAQGDASWLQGREAGQVR